MLAIVGTLAGIGFVSGRQILRGQQNRSALVTLQQSIWQGATAAAAHGVPTELVRNGNHLTVQPVGGGSAFRTFELPATVTTNLPEGASLVFTPPGRIDPATLQALPDPLTLDANGVGYRLEISLIGEVRLVRRS